MSKNIPTTQSLSKRNRILSIGLLLFAEIFYLVFALMDGVDLNPDSSTYINMDIAREPLYPLFLAMLRGIFHKEQTYLLVAVIIQSLLAGFATWILSMYLMKLMKLSIPEALVIYSLPLAVSLLCRFGAQRGFMYSNSILTEGVTLSVYLIFFRFLIEYIIEHTKKSFAWCTVLAILMIATRKQMMICLGMFAIGIILVMVKKRSFKKGIVTLLVSCIIVLLLSSGIDYIYNYSIRGVWGKHSSDTRFLTTMGYYVADSEDMSNIDDENLRNLASEIYTICDTNGYTRSHATGNWNDRVDHFLNHYDLIQISTMWPMVQEYVKNVEQVAASQIDYRTDEIFRVMNKALLYSNLDKAFLVVLDNFGYGLVTSIAQKHPVLNWYVVIAYLSFIGLLIMRFIQWKQARKENSQSSSLAGHALLICLLVLLSILMNVGLVSLVIFCQPRYTIYNMSLFYIAGLLLLKKRNCSEPHS